MVPVATQIFYARKSPLAVLIVIASAMLLLLILHPAGKKSALLFLALFIGLVVVFLYFLLNKISLTINNDGLEYKTAFRTKNLLWREVTASRLNFEFHGHSGDIFWLFNLNNSRDLKFSISFFSRKELRAIAEAVVAKCCNTCVSKKIQQMSQGKFPWYIF